MPGQGMLRHKIGCTRTVKTAVMVVAYLSERYQRNHFHYVFKEATEPNGWWSADIILNTFDGEDFNKLYPNVTSECRAFVAGLGEIWT